MSLTISQVKDRLSPKLHGGSLNKVRNFYEACELAANEVLSNLDPVETMRNAPLSNFVYDDLWNYTLPSDFRKIIDLYPQADRSSLDYAERNYAERFDRERSVSDKIISIEGSEGDKILRINWSTDYTKTFHTANSLTSNGIVAIVGTASGLKLNKQIKYLEREFGH